MTVSSTVASVTFNCDGTSTVFTCPFRVLSASDLRAYIITVSTGDVLALDYGADYTVVVGSANAEATLAAVYSSSYQVRFRRVTSRLQETDWRDNDPFPAESVETAADRLTMIAQEDQEGLSRSLVVPEGEQIDELPIASDRAGKLLGFDSSGNPTVSAPADGSAASLALDLASSASPSDGAGMVYFSASVSYAAGTVGHKLRQIVSAFDDMSAAQVADVVARTALVDVRSALQVTFDRVKATGGVMVFPPGKYLITGYFGTDQTNASDWADNVTLHFEPGAEIYLSHSGSSGTWYYHAISLEGDNVSVTGSGYLSSSRVMTWDDDLTSQRSTYYFGLIIGGKSYRRITAAVGQEVSGVTVSGLKIRNFNAPIAVYAASNYRVEGCDIADFTDTGILIDDCLSDGWVRANKVYRGGDDHIFARHYSGTPWSAAGEYIGRLTIDDNDMADTFAKHIGVGGYSDVTISGNKGKNCWYAGINLEIDGTTWLDNTKNIKICDNILVDSARAFDPSHPVATYQLAPTDTTQCAGILATTSVTGWPLKRFENIEVYDNLIVNPHYHGISISGASRVAIRGNTMVAGRTTKSAVNYDTGGAAVRSENVDGCSISAGNKIVGNGSQSWAYCYEITGDTYTDACRIDGNADERFATGLLVAMSATVKTKVSYDGVSMYGTASWTPGSISNGASSAVDVTVTGAEIGDMVRVSYTQDLQGIVATGYVRTAGVVKAVFSNTTGGSVALSAGTIKALCTRRV